MTLNDMIRAAELDILNTVIDGALARGWKMNVDNGGDGYELDDASADKALIVEHMTATDTATLIVFGKTAVRLGRIEFVYGNDGYDVIADYSAALTDFLDGGPVGEAIDRWDVAITAGHTSTAERPATTVVLTQRQLDTVLAALRYWQWGLEQPAGLMASSRGSGIMEIATNGRTGDDAALLSSEIDALCEAINV